MPTRCHAATAAAAGPRHTRWTFTPISRRDDGDDTVGIDALSSDNHREAAMTTLKHSRLAALRARVKRIFSEIGYANHRMFDIRTGVRCMQSHESPRGRATG